MRVGVYMNNNSIVNNVLLSVIVPIYNMEKYLDKCIKSIINQTYTNLEIILIDDGSKDSSYSICEKYKEKDDRIKVYRKENGGLSDAKNFGISKANGEFLTFVDADDWIDVNMYEVMLKQMKEKNAEISICGRYIEYENGASKKWKNNTYLEMNKKEALIYLNSFYDFDMASWDKIYKTELFNNIRFPVGKKCEDAYTTYLLFEKCDKIIYISNCFYHYFQRSGSISRNKELNMDYIYAAKEQMDFFKENYPDLSFAGETNYIFAIKSIFQVSVERKIKLNDEFKKMLKEVKKYAKIIFGNKYISKKKKVTFCMFAYFRPLYKFLLLVKYNLK